MIITIYCIIYVKRKINVPYERKAIKIHEHLNEAVRTFILHEKHRLSKNTIHVCVNNRFSYNIFYRTILPQRHRKHLKWRSPYKG